jgi:hypothetical protein
MGFGYFLIRYISTIFNTLNTNGIMFLFGIMSIPFSIIKEGSIELLPTFYSIIFFLQIQILAS